MFSVDRNSVLTKFNLKPLPKSIPIPKYVYLNAFGNPYGILNYKTKHKIHDHIEWFVIKENQEIISWVVITSPYEPMESLKDELLDNGYIQIDPIYNNMARSFLKIIYRRKHQKSKKDFFPPQTQSQL